jgi:hypothetical protein
LFTKKTPVPGTTEGADSAAASKLKTNSGSVAAPAFGMPALTGRPEPLLSSSARPLRA